MITGEMTALGLFREASGVLRKNGIEEPEKEAEILLCSLLNIKREELFANDPLIDDEKQRLIFKALEERTAGRPLQYITGYVEFYGLKIFVGEGVLIPRPETEIVVSEALSLKTTVNPRVLDLCTGSGCIALSIAKEWKDSFVTGTDSSETALSYAEKNRRYHHIENVEFIKADLFPPNREGFDLIVTNPPYVGKEEMKLLQREVKSEPYEALYGGTDGLDFYRRILGSSGRYLKKEGFIVLEIGAGQSGAVEAMAKAKGLRVLKKRADLSGIERVMVLGCKE